MPRTPRMHYIIAYDITDDANRTRLSHLLLDYGERVQKSVFEADLDAEDVKEILKRAANYLAAGDSLRLYPQCKTCAGRVQTLGRPTIVATPSIWIV
jgi:CRISPR-associated protein Cas2